MADEGELVSVGVAHTGVTKTFPVLGRTGSSRSLAVGTCYSRAGQSLNSSFIFRGHSRLEPFRELESVESIPGLSRPVDGCTGIGSGSRYQIEGFARPRQNRVMKHRKAIETRIQRRASIEPRYQAGKRLADGREPEPLYGIPGERATTPRRQRYRSFRRSVCTPPATFRLMETFRLRSSSPPSTRTDRYGPWA